jgi:hypothetical protein
MEIAAIADGDRMEVARHGGGSANLNMLLAVLNAIYMETGGPQKMIDGEVPRARRTRHEQRGERRGNASAKWGDVKKGQAIRP